MPCRHCGAADHVGTACPKRRGGTFAPTSATAPPVRPAAEAAYRDEVRRPPQMAAELAEFARRVFAHPGSMAPRCDRRANEIYALYCGHTGGGEDTRPASAAEVQLFETLGYAVRAMGGYLEGVFQQTHVLDHATRKPKRLEFQAIRAWVERGPDALPLSTLTDFVHFFPPGRHDRITHRLYLNVPLVQVAQVFMSVQTYMSERHQASGVCYFKVCGPRSVGQRAETFVVYCRDEASAVRLGQHLAARHGPAAFALAVPAMTTRVPNTAGGLAVGAEPAKTATGMKVGAAGPREESAQSFGSLRSQLLALAVENYLENGDRVEGDSELDIFNRFVCAAFRGFGLDPMNPGG